MALVSFIPLSILPSQLATRTLFSRCVPSFRLRVSGWEVLPIQLSKNFWPTPVNPLLLICAPTSRTAPITVSCSRSGPKIPEKATPSFLSNWSTAPVWYMVPIWSFICSKASLVASLPECPNGSRSITFPDRDLVVSCPVFRNPLNASSNIFLALGVSLVLVALSPISLVMAFMCLLLSRPDVRIRWPNFSMGIFPLNPEKSLVNLLISNVSKNPLGDDPVFGAVPLAICQ